MNNKKTTKNILDDYTFRALMNTLMCCDPWPTGEQEDHDSILDLVDSNAKFRGYADWIDAYHIFRPILVHYDEKIIKDREDG